MIGFFLAGLALGLMTGLLLMGLSLAGSELLKDRQARRTLRQPPTVVDTQWRVIR